MAVVSQARELSPEEQQERAAYCFALNEQIKQALFLGRQALWELAKGLYEFHRQNGWSALDYESMNEWLADPEISISRAQFTRIVRRYESFVVRKALPVSRDELPEEKANDPGTVVLSELDPSKLDVVVGAIDSGRVTTEDALGDVQALGWRDLREKYWGSKEEKPPVEPEPEPVLAAGGKEMAVAAAMVDSWLSLGGDRRKAQRHFAKLVRLHPFFTALAEVQACLAGEEGAPVRAEVGANWQLVVATLGLEFADAED